jgi:hypothetical protein
MPASSGCPSKRSSAKPACRTTSPPSRSRPTAPAWTAWLGYQDSGDWVVVSDGTVSARITEKGDHQGPAIAALSNGWVLAAWSQREGSEFHIYTSFRVAGRWTPGRRMTTLSGSHIWPHLSADTEGHAVLVWQSLREGRSAIRTRRFDGRNWSVEEPVNQDTGNAWAPTALVWQRRSMVAWDSYTSGAYQVWFREWPNAPERVTVGDSFAVRPSIAVSPDGGRVVVAWEESDPLWGKDFAYLTDRPRHRRYIKIGACGWPVRDDGMWRALTGDPAESLPAGIRRFVQQPRIVFDAAGRLHLLFRCRTFAGTARIDNWAAGGRWETFPHAPRGRPLDSGDSHARQRRPQWHARRARRGTRPYCRRVAYRSPGVSAGQVRRPRHQHHAHCRRGRAVHAVDRSHARATGRGR